MFVSCSQIEQQKITSKQIRNGFLIKALFGYEILNSNNILTMIEIRGFKLFSLSFVSSKIFQIFEFLALCVNLITTVF